MKLSLKHALIMLPAASLLLAFGALASGETADALLRRYPYDPACPWGRVGNGKGLIVRCLTEGEAQGLRSGTLLAANAPPASPAPSAGAPSAGAPSSAAMPAPVASAVPAPSSSAVAPAVPPDESEPEPTPPSSTDQKFDVTVGPVTADSGTLGIGKLGVPKDKYQKCVNDNGGLKEAIGEVQVRFLLRQRGRAEGVSVAKRTGLSAEAARCISEVVDRRYVGVPDGPLVGATVVIKLAKVGK